jgi:hypothetical protein
MRLLQQAPNQPPIYVGGVVRIGPRIGQSAAACFWKFWTGGNEIYAATRSGGNQTKISVHASGEIHMHFGPRNMQKFAPPVCLSDGWAHAVEIRFLIGHGASRPPPELVKLRKQNHKVLLADVPSDHVLILNLLVGKSTTPLPAAFGGAVQIWRSPLKDGRVAVLVCGILPMNEENAKTLKHIRSELNPKANYEGKLVGQPPYLECVFAVPGSGGNVVFVVPMGAEGYRFEGDDAELPSLEPRPIQITSPDAAIPILAPDGEDVGTLSIDGITTEIALLKNRNVVGPLGTVTLSIDSERLRFGEVFARPTVGIESLPSIAGGQPKTWAYPVNTRFDGEELTVGIGLISCALRNANVAVPMDALKEGEELLIRAPVTEIELRVSRTKRIDSQPLTGSFRLRDIAQQGN